MRAVLVTCDRCKTQITVEDRGEIAPGWTFSKTLTRKPDGDGLDEKNRDLCPTCNAHVEAAFSDNS